jgi:hypothetical protein
MSYAWSFSTAMSIKLTISDVADQRFLFDITVVVGLLRALYSITSDGFPAADMHLIKLVSNL